MRTAHGRFWRRAQASLASTRRDALGLREPAFDPGAFFRCELMPMSVIEQPYADGVIVKRSFEVRCRWQTVEMLGISEVDRIIVDGRTLRIQSIINRDNDYMEAQILAEEIN